GNMALGILTSDYVRVLFHLPNEVFLPLKRTRPADCVGAIDNGGASFDGGSNEVRRESEILAHPRIPLRAKLDLETGVTRAFYESKEILNEARLIVRLLAQRRPKKVGVYGE